MTDEASPFALGSTTKSSEDSTAPEVLVAEPGAMMPSDRSSPASNPPAIKPHAATGCTVSLRCHPPIDQR
jgi:hypothetical protein